MSCARFNEEEGLDAAEATWSRIDAELAPGAPAAEVRRELRARARGLRPALALGVVTIAIGGVFALRSRHSAMSDAQLLGDARAELESAEEHYARAASDLRALALRERSVWPEERRRRFDEQLAEYDHEIALHRALARALRARRDLPGLPLGVEGAGPASDEVLREEEQLYRAWRAQIAFLEDALVPSAGAAVELR
jgi:hypothetical protein